MGYRTLGNRLLAATVDDSGLNPGNWTVHYTAKQIGVTVPEFEIWHIALKDVQPGAQGVLYINTAFFSFVRPLGGSEWDPSQPAILRPADEVFLTWNYAATGTPPTTNLWLRYDSSQWSNA